MSSFAPALPDPRMHPEIYASVPAKRLFAWLIDMVIVFVISVVLVPLTAFIGAFFFPLMMVVVSFFYRLMTIAGGSSTWGMRLMAIEFRRLDGDRFSAQDALLHTLGFAVLWAIPVLQLISAVLMVTSERGQGLTDHILATTAVNRLRG